MYRMKLELEKAIKNEEYIIYLQPKFDTQTEHIIGAEALLRKKKNDQIIMPNEFLPIYEENGLIMMLDMYVLETVCKLQQKWRKENKQVSRPHISFFSFRLLAYIPSQLIFQQFSSR